MKNTILLCTTVLNTITNILSGFAAIMGKGGAEMVVFRSIPEEAAVIVYDEAGIVLLQDVPEELQGQMELIR